MRGWSINSFRSKGGLREAARIRWITLPARTMTLRIRLLALCLLWAPRPGRSGSLTNSSVAPGRGRSIEVSELRRTSGVVDILDHTKPETEKEQTMLSNRALANFKTY